MSTVREPSGSTPSNPGEDYDKTVTRVVVNQTVAGTTQIAAASSGKRNKIVGGMLTISLAGTLKFIDGSGDLTGPYDLAASSGFNIPHNPKFPLIQTAVNSALSVVTTLGAARGVILVVTE